MALLRFPTVRSLYEAFPTAEEDVGAPPSDEGCVAFLHLLLADCAWRPAVSFCAYMLPRREAVAWGCRSLRKILSKPAPAEAVALDAAEMWALQPEERLRRAALQIGNEGNAGLPGMWMALAAGWSGGSIVPDGPAVVRAPPEQTARAVRAGLLIAASRMQARDAPKMIEFWLKDALKFVDGDFV